MGNYVDYHRCQKLKGEDYEPCNFFAKNFQTVCPNAWIEKWNEQREKNAFPANTKQGSFECRRPKNQLLWNILCKLGPILVFLCRNKHGKMYVETPFRREWR